MAVLVEDAWQHLGLGRRLTTQLSKLAAARGISHLHADVLADNRPAVSLVRRTGAGVQTGWSGGVVSYDFPLKAA